MHESQLQTSSGMFPALCVVLKAIHARAGLGLGPTCMLTRLHAGPVKLMTETGFIIIIMVTITMVTAAFWVFFCSCNTGSRSLLFTITGTMDTKYGKPFFFTSKLHH